MYTKDTPHTHSLRPIDGAKQSTGAKKKRKKIEKKTTKINEQKLYIKLLSTIYAKNGLSLSQVELGEMALATSRP